jgi:2'-5' RNA ligase
MRLFIAIDFPKNIKEKLAAKVTILKKCDLAAKWVNIDNLHLTLKFLGDVKEDNLDKIKNIITKAAKQFKPLEVNLVNFGFFPNEKRPRVFFMATDHEEILKSISRILEEDLEKLGFRKEDRFKSHITLARLKGPKNIDCLKRAIKNISLDERFLINEIALFKSTLTRTGPVYEKIFTAHSEI